MASQEGNQTELAKKLASALGVGYLNVLDDLGSFGLALKRGDADSKGPDIVSFTDLLSEDEERTISTGQVAEALLSAGLTIILSPSVASEAYFLGLTTPKDL